MPATDIGRPPISRAEATARRAGRRALVALFSLFATCWFLAVIGISRNMRLPIDERWATSAMLFLEAIIGFLWICDAYDWRRAFRFSTIVLLFAFAAEFIGVRTGFPFGRYHYTGALAPVLLDSVPVPITCAWLMIVLGSLAAAHATIPRGNLRAVVPLSAVLATGLDACLEPTAFHVKGYWLWDHAGRYYGIPAMNFAGWLCIALLINAFAAHALWPDRVARLPVLAAIPLTLFWSSLLMFAIIDLSRGYPLGALIGAALTFTNLSPLARGVHRQRVAPFRMTSPSTRRIPAGASGSNSRECRRRTGR